MKNPEQIGTENIPFHQALIRSCLIFLLLVCFASCSDEQKTHFNIPEGYAKHTLKDFARQAEVEILFDLQIVDDTKTKAVLGSHYPIDALGIMLEETDLTYHIEIETGAFAVAHKDFTSIKLPDRD